MERPELFLPISRGAGNDGDKQQRAKVLRVAREAYMIRQRCAIYTRKSTEEGLEQDFNSLDAQREACAAYILSQKHEGWAELSDRYDDGGFSGGSMDRPGLTQLLNDVEVGRVDVIVVYKVDRLTRSLADFAKMVDLFDGAGVSFVSVTQAFNTTSSMGWLTLNVLLSFAQFEREVTAERIRDKVAASKRKGIWMGGAVPMGYDVKDKALIMNRREANAIRTIFSEYLAVGSVARTVPQARRAQYRKQTPDRPVRAHDGWHVLLSWCALQHPAQPHLHRQNPSQERAL